MVNRIENDKILLNFWLDEKSEQGLDKLVRQYKDKVFSFILYLSGCNSNTAYEITADSFAETLTNMRLSSGNGFSVQLFSRVVTRCRKTKPVIFFDAFKMVRYDPSKKLILQTAKNALKDMPFDEKALLLLRDQVQLSYDEIAAIMNVSADDIKTRTWQSRALFREKVEESLNKNQGA